MAVGGKDEPSTVRFVPDSEQRGNTLKSFRGLSPESRGQNRSFIGLGLIEFSGRVTTRAEATQGTLAQGHISSNILVYEDWP